MNPKFCFSINHPLSPVFPRLLMLLSNYMSSDSICSLLQVRVEIDFTMQSEQNICLAVS